MTFFDKFLVLWWLLGIVLNVAIVGRKRDPITPGMAALIVLVHLSFIGGLLWSRGVF